MNDSHFYKEGRRVRVSEANPYPTVTTMGSGDLQVDAWGVPKVSLAHSLFSGLWTFDIPASMWKVIENGTEIYDGTYTGAASSGGALYVTSNTNNTLVESIRSPRYQANRGHLYSTAGWMPNSDYDGIREWGLFNSRNGVFFRLTPEGLYAVIKSAGSETQSQLLDMTQVDGFDVEKGNIYDIQFQWRGVGNYKFFINNVLVHTFSLLGTLTALSIENPALPVAYKCTKTTQDVTMYFGCVDVTSENGATERRQYNSITSGDLVSMNNDNTDGEAILAIRIPTTVSTKPNTRNIVISAVSTFTKDEANVRVFYTRTPTVIGGIATNADPTLGWADVDASGTVQYMIGGHDSTLETTFETNHSASNSKSMVFRRQEMDYPLFMRNEDLRNAPFYLCAGDYLVVTIDPDGDAKQSGCTIEWSEEV